MLAIVNGKVMPVSGEPIEGGAILIRDGKIAAVGKDLKIPSEARVIDADGRPVTPGIIEAHVHIGLGEAGIGWAGADVNESSDPVTAYARAIDGLNPLDTAFDEFRAAGITCANVVPGSGNIIGGTGLAIKCQGTIVDDMVVKNPTGMKAALGENPKGSYGRRNKLPSTRMGSAAVMRETLFKAREYLKKKEKAEGEDDVSKLPKHDKNLEALLPVLRGEIPLHIHCHRADDITTAVRLCREFEVPFVLEHVTEANHIIDLLKGADTHLAIGPTMHYGSKVENRERDFRTPVEVARAGIPFCLITDHPVLHGKYLTMSAGLAVTWGMDYDLALRSVTLSAAEHVGIADRVGSLEVGKDADIVIWSGDPLDYITFADYTIIDGEVAYQREVE